MIAAMLAMVLAFAAPAPADPAPAWEVFPNPLSVAATRTVWVEDHTGWRWPVTAAEPWVDQYTGTVMRYGVCHVAARCIRIYERTVRSIWAAVTRPNSNGATIYVNPQRNYYPYSWRLSILRHELVHAMGYYTHWPYCTDLMYYAVTCPNGRLVPQYLHPSIRALLAVH